LQNACKYRHLVYEAFLNLSGDLLGLLHTIRRMLEASGGCFQSRAEANYDVLLEHYLVQSLLLYRVSWLCNAR
jgi:hypothetical protein